MKQEEEERLRQEEEERLKQEEEERLRQEEEERLKQEEERLKQEEEERLKQEEEERLKQEEEERLKQEEEKRLRQEEDLRLIKEAEEAAILKAEQEREADLAREQANKQKEAAAKEAAAAAALAESEVKELDQELEVIENNEIADSDQEDDDEEESGTQNVEINIPGLELDEQEISALINPESTQSSEPESSDESTNQTSLSEKEKMLAGELYIAWGDEFTKDKRRARNLLKQFNNIDVEDKKLTASILKELFNEIGEYIYIEPSFKCDYGYNITLGNNFYAGEGCIISDSGKVTIGDNCIMSPRVAIYTLAYPLNQESRISGYEYAKPVTIGNSVWIGGGAIINPGVTIGDNSVISPGAVIVEDVPSNVLVSGNPAKIIKELNNEKDDSVEN